MYRDFIYLFPQQSPTYKTEDSAKVALTPEISLVIPAYNEVSLTLFFVQDYLKYGNYT